MIAARARRTVFVLVSFAGFAAASFCVGLVAGSVPLSFSDVATALTGRGSGAIGEIVLTIRLPRLLAAFACGGLLALAGTLLQVLLRNPLADPYVLGISGGAGLGLLAEIGRASCRERV